MRRDVWVLGGCALAAGCAQVLGLEEWKDPGSTGGSGGSSTAITATSSSRGATGGGGDPTCADGVKNGLETDVDCGGDACPPCADGEHCNDDADCRGLGCVDGTCVTVDGGAACEAGIDPTCNDCIKNGLETDVDCGGDACLPCGADKTCKLDGDCTSARCVNLVCATGSSGTPCRGAGDCASGQCAAGACWTGSCCR